MRIILASKSPRRQELLKVMGIEDFDIIPAVGQESGGGETEPGKIAENIALGKALEIAKTRQPDDIIIGADTIVCCGGRILGKPKDQNDAFSMLELLSGRKHSVYTGVAVVKGDTVEADSVKTDVYFRKMEVYEIEKYIESGEPMDKAGAYGVQGRGSVFVDKIDGDFFNVVGLPLSKLYQMLKNVGLDIYR